MEYDEETPFCSNLVPLVFYDKPLFGWSRDYRANNDEMIFPIFLTKFKGHFTFFHHVQFDVFQQLEHTYH
jgi:hypothetical protein